MKESISRYLNELIKEYGQETKDGWSLDISAIDPKEKESLIYYLINNEEGMQDVIQDHIKFLFNERLPLFESENNYAKGFFPHHDTQTGEVIWSDSI